MNLQQLSMVRRWHVQHRHHHPVEFQIWDLVLMLWVMGAVGLPVSVLLQLELAVAACLAGFAAPSLYVALRKGLHRAQRLRCDWLPAVARPPR